jgi:hypothetical protein
MSNITCNNISQISVVNNHYNHYNHNVFEIFYAAIILLMPISKIYTQLIKIVVVRRKINQYTNWNILMILVNSMLFNVFNIDNHLISRFIAINSFQIMSLFHMYILYDSNILFYTMDANPLVLNHRIFNIISKTQLVRFEYFVANIIVHILPVYIYRDYLALKDNNTNHQFNMFQHLIMFKFMWVLNIFGDFNITSIYVPTFHWCNVKLVNLIVVIDYILYKLVNY